MGRGELAGLLSQVGRRADVAGLHLQVAREQVARRNRVADPASRLRFFLIRCLEDQLDRLDFRLRILGLLLELHELPASLRHTLDEDLGQLGGAEAAAGFFGDAHGKRSGPEAAGAASGNGARASDRAARDLGRLPRPDEQDSFRLAGAVDEERLVLLSFVIAGRDGPFETGILEWRDACSRGDDHGQEGCLDIQERLGRDDSLHDKCSMMASPKAEVETSVAPGSWRARS